MDKTCHIAQISNNILLYRTVNFNRGACGENDEMILLCVRASKRGRRRRHLSTHVRGILHVKKTSSMYTQRSRMDPPSYLRTYVDTLPAKESEGGGGGL